MEIKDDRIDSGKAFDWGKTSREYAKYRDNYPEKSGWNLKKQVNHSMKRHGKCIPNGSCRRSKRLNDECEK